MKHFTFPLLLLLMACNLQPQNPDITTITVKLEDKAVLLSQIFSDMKVVPLQTTDSSLIAPECKIAFTDSLIFVEGEKSIHLFDYQGNIIRNIKHYGGGQGEYLSLSDFIVDDSLQKIEILDKQQQKVLQYNYQGSFLAEIPLHLWAINLIRLRNQLILYCGNERNELSPYKFQAISNRKHTAFAKTDPHRSKYLHILSLTNSYQNKNECLFSEPFNDTLYQLHPDTLQPKYVISYTEGKVPPQFYQNHRFANVMEFFQEFNKHRYVNGTYNAFETNNQLYFQCYYQGKKYLVIYHKHSQQAFAYHLILDDIFLSSPTELPFQDPEFNFFAQGNKVLFTVPAYWLTNTKQTPRQPFPPLTPDDNPLLFIGTIDN